MVERRITITSFLAFICATVSTMPANATSTGRDVETVLKARMTNIGQWEGPPICPHANELTPDVLKFAQGSPWIKVLYTGVCARAKSTGAKVFLRPWDQSTGPDGDTKAGGIKMASDILESLRKFPTNLWPDAISFQNEFNDVGPKTAQAFLDYYDTLRKGGYKGLIIFGSYGPGGPTDITEWNRPFIRRCWEKADGIETHEYWDLTVSNYDSWLAHRHVRMMAMYPELRQKAWFIGEFGSDAVDKGEDKQNRSGWRDRSKLTAEEYIRQIKIYRSGSKTDNVLPPEKNILAVFLYQQGSPGWQNFEVLGTPVAKYMQSTWKLDTGNIHGLVLGTDGSPVKGAVVRSQPDNQTTKTDEAGRWWLFALPVKDYTLTAEFQGRKKSGESKVKVTGGGLVNVTIRLSN